MPPKKGKAAAKGKAKKEPQAEPPTDGVSETVQETAAAPVEDAPPAEETKAEEPLVEEPKSEETATKDAPATREPTVEAEPEVQPAVEAAPEAAPKETKSKKRKGAAPTTAEPAAPETKAEEKKPASKKRKTDAPPPREGERKSGRGAQKAQPTTEQLLNYLLSEASADFCRPEDEAQELNEKSELRTYSSSALSPFEELICAVVLSRPISHKLGLRSIRTILNDPYSFTTPKAIISAGKEKRHQALVDAKTQHKEKTAEQLGLVADVVAHKFGKDDTDTSLDKLRDQANKGWDMERDLLQDNIKGIGRTGLDIFFRRVQWLWPEAYPFVDERSSRGIEKLGLPKNPDELAKTLNRYWAKLDTNAVEGDKETKKRRAFVIICERATSADLEGKSDAILEAAASS